MASRRLFIASAPLVMLAGCVDGQGAGAASSPTAPAQNGGVKAPAGSTTAPPPTPGNATLSPQVMYGRANAPNITELAVSLHCGATRNYARSTLRTRLAEAKAGQRVIILTHYVRTENELPLGVNLLRTGEAYPEVMLAILGLTARLDRALSAAEAQQFLAGAGFGLSPAISAHAAQAALATARAAYREIGVHSTPYVKEGRNA